MYIFSVFFHRLYVLCSSYSFPATHERAYEWVAHEMDVGMKKKYLMNTFLWLFGIIFFRIFPSPILMINWRNLRISESPIIKTIFRLFFWENLMKKSNWNFPISINCWAFKETKVGYLRSCIYLKWMQLVWYDISNS